MRLYTVHLRRGGLDPVADIVLIKEGFNWPALLFSLLWALWHGLWLVALGLLLIEVLFSAAAAIIGIGPVLNTVLSVAIAVIFAFVANDLRRWTLSRRGFAEAGVVAGRNSEAAEMRLFDHNPALREGAAP